MISLKTYFEKMPTPCFVSNRRQEIDRQGITGITLGNILGGMATTAVVGVGAAASSSDLERTATILKNLEKELVKAETNVAAKI